MKLLTPAGIIVVAVVLLTGCATGVWSANTPNATEITCPGGEVPVAKEGYTSTSGSPHAGEMLWECGPAPCATGQRVDWERYGEGDSFLVAPRCLGASSERKAGTRSFEDFQEDEAPTSTESATPNDTCASFGVTPAEGTPATPSLPPIEGYMRVDVLIEKGYVRNPQLGGVPN